MHPPSDGFPFRVCSCCVKGTLHGISREGERAPEDMISMADASPRREKPRLKLPDLTPRKDARGGGHTVLHPETPPLPIPPPGFVVRSEPNELSGDH